MQENGVRYRLIVVLLVGIAAGCFSTQTVSDSDSTQPHTVTIDEACGNPTRFPVSQECMSLIGRFSAVMQRRSDLVMAMWRACPDNPCSVIEFGVGDTPGHTGVGAAPSCQKADALFYQEVESNAPPNSELDSAARACEKAQHEDYSCSALQADSVYSRQQANLASEEQCSSKRCGKLIKEANPWLDCERNCELAWNEPTDSDCQQARDNLASFNQKVQDAMVNAELRDAFAPPTPVLISPPSPERPVIVQQAPAPNFLAPPYVPSPPVFTHCTSFGPTTSCITH